MTATGPYDEEAIVVALPPSPPPAQSTGLGRMVLPAAYLLLGLLLGLLLHLGPGPAAPPLRWLRRPGAAPAAEVWRRAAVDDERRVRPFMYLRQRLDDVIVRRVNGIETPAEDEPDGFPSDLLDDAVGQFEEAFDALAAAPPADDPAESPDCLVEDTEDGLLITCAGPDLSPDQATVGLADGQLTVSIASGLADETSQLPAEFTRTFLVPRGVRPEDVRATAGAGALSIAVPRPPAAPQAPPPILVQSA
eukprot:EG_transcript_16561